MNRDGPSFLGLEVLNWCMMEQPYTAKQVGLDIHYSSPCVGESDNKTETATLKIDMIDWDLQKLSHMDAQQFSDMNASVFLFVHACVR